MKLKSFKPIGLKWQFTLENDKGQTKDILLRERADWPCLLGSDIATVEKWLFSRYNLLFDFFGGAIF